MVNAAEQYNEKGVAMLEFAIVLPLLILLALGGIELSRTMQHAQLAATISREAASIAYRECTNQDIRATRSCLEDVRASLRLFAASLIDGSDVAISVYEYDEDLSEYHLWSIVPASAMTDPVNPTRFGITSGAPINAEEGTARGASMYGSVDPQILLRHKVMVVGEAFIPYRSPVFNILGSFFFNAEVFYEAAII